VAASAFQLEQVLLNLVGNAHEALRGRGAGAITIAGAVDDGRAVVEVRDNGPGITPEALPRIFEPFFTTKASGTGLGLAISAGIMRDAGGELTAANRPGGGAVFRLAFPAAAWAPRARSTRRSRPRAQPVASRSTITAARSRWRSRTT